MKFLKIYFLVLLVGLAAVLISETNIFAKKSGCEAYIYAINNSAFDISALKINEVDYGSLVMGKNKTYKVELLNDEAKKFKVKIVYENTNYLEPRSYTIITKKLECGSTDSLFIAHTQ
jgi:hypothetical protein